MTMKRRDNDMNDNTSFARSNLPPYFPMLIISLITAVISSCVLSPMYTQICSDVTLMYTVLPIVIDYLIIVFDIIYISLIFAIISCSAYAYMKGEERKFNGLLLSGAVIILKHILNLTVSSIIDNYIDVTFDIPLTIILIAADLVTIIIVRIIAVKRSARHLAHAKKMEKAAKYLDNVIYDQNADIFPFGSLFNIRNAVLFPIFVGIVLSVSVLIIQRLFADFVVIGLPSSFYEVMEIIISYISDIVLGIIGYVAAYYAAVYTFTKKQTEQTN